MNEELSAEFVRSEAVEWKQQAVALFRRLPAICYLARAVNDVGGVAHCLGIGVSANQVNTWADVQELFGEEIEEAFDDICPLDASWWRVVAEADDPAVALADAVQEELGKPELRRRHGTKWKRDGGPLPLYNGGAKWQRCEAGKAEFFIDLGAKPPDNLPQDVLLIVKEKRDG